MFDFINNMTITNYITENRHADLNKILLKKQLFPELSNQELVNQIQSKKNTYKKMPLWFSRPEIVYHTPLNIEQSSSELTAKFKAEFFENFQKTADLTGGFGVDSYYFSKLVKEHIHFEIDKELSRKVAHNFTVLNRNNIKCIAQNSLEYLSENDVFFDGIYIDPARRNSGQKLYKLEDCVPNVVKAFNLLRTKTNYIVLKASPIYDLKMGIKELSFIKDIYCIALKNEVKELLFVVDFESVKENNNPNIICKDLVLNHSFRFTLEEESSVGVSYSKPLEYIYIPNACIVKSGAYKIIAKKFRLKKMAQHTQLYTSDICVKDFPGRIFKNKKEGTLNKRFIQSAFPDGKANIIIKNHPLSLQNLIKKTKLIEGGESYLLLCSSSEKKHVLKLEKIDLRA